jgi:3'-phosphoadenosine 5'-phosphosulfate sulfotransferase (PAPS reductase)/FAD synthetase
MTLEQQLDKAREILLRAVDEHEPAHIFGLLSGGHDSLTVTHFAESVLGNKLRAVVHIDTGIGIPETQQFVIDTCERYGWPLRIISALDARKADGTADPQDYRNIVLKHGFPGASSHRFMYIRLKQRQLDGLSREHNGKIMLISGVRNEESVRRMGTAKEVQKEGRRIWVAPFLHMTADDLEGYRHVHRLPENPVKKILCMSGECLCGAYAKPNELKQIETFYPEVGKRLRDLEKEVAAAGFPWGWDEQPPAWWGKRKAAEKAGQVDAFQEEAEQEIQMLCTSCQFKYEQEDEGPQIRRIA